MKKKSFLLFTLLFTLIFSVLVFSCSGAQDFLSQENTSEDSVPKGYARICSNLHEDLPVLQKNIKNNGIINNINRTIMPTYRDFFVNVRISTKPIEFEMAYVVERWYSLEEFSSFTYDLPIGTYYAQVDFYNSIQNPEDESESWDMECFKKKWEPIILKEGEVFAFEITKEDFLKKENHGNNSGILYLSLSFPKEQASFAEVRVCSFDLEQHDFSSETAYLFYERYATFPIDEYEKDGITFTKYEKQYCWLDFGYYYLIIQFYDSNSDFIKQAVYHIFISPIAQTNAELEIKDLNVLHSITYAIDSDSYWTDSAKTEVDIPKTFSITEDVSLPDNSIIKKEHYTIEGWYTDSTFTQKVGSDGFSWQKGTVLQDVTLYAKWEPKQYKVIFADRYSTPPENFSSYKAFSGKFGDEDKSFVTVTYGDSLTLESPVNRFATTENPIEFEGWYTDTKCSSTAKITSFTAGEIENDRIIYANWKAKNVYIDEENGSDLNSGLSYDEPIATVKEATFFFKDSTFANTETSLFVLSSITNEESINYLSWLNTYYKNTVRRYNSFTTGPLVIVSGENSVIGVTFDGGVEWESVNANGALVPKINFISSSAPLIEITSTGSLSLSNVTLKNNYNTNFGGAIVNNGTLTFIFDNVISSNYTKEQGGAIYNTGTIIAERLTIGGDEAINGNYAEKYGGGIYTNSSTGTVTLGSDSTQVFINHNASKSGGGIYQESGTLSLKNTRINNNIAENAAGICTKATLTAEDTHFTGNSATNNGGAITVYSKKMHNTILKNVMIFENSAKNNGYAIYATDESYVTVDSCEIYQNHCSNSNATSGAIHLQGTVYLTGSCNIIINDNADFYFPANGRKLTLKEDFLIPDSVSVNPVLLPESYPTSENPKIQLLDLSSYTQQLDSVYNFFTVQDDIDGNSWKIASYDDGSGNLTHGCVVPKNPAP